MCASHYSPYKGNGTVICDTSGKWSPNEPSCSCKEGGREGGWEKEKEREREREGGWVGGREGEREGGRVGGWVDRERMEGGSRDRDV